MSPHFIPYHFSFGRTVNVALHGPQVRFDLLLNVLYITSLNILYCGSVQFCNISYLCKSLRKSFSKEYFLIREIDYFSVKKQRLLKSWRGMKKYVSSTRLLYTYSIHIHTHTHLFCSHIFENYFNSLRFSLLTILTLNFCRENI